MQELLLSIQEIHQDPRPNQDFFQFNEMLEALENSEYDHKCGRMIADNFRQWVERCSYHTFPKKRIAWLNTLKNQAPINRIVFVFSPGEVVRNLRHRRQIPKYATEVHSRVRLYLKGIKHDIKDEIVAGTMEQIRCMCSLRVTVSEDRCLEYLLEFGLIYASSPTRFRVASLVYQKFEHSQARKRYRFEPEHHPEIEKLRVDSKKRMYLPSDRADSPEVPYDKGDRP